MTEFLLRSITKGKFEEWHPESFSSLEAVCEQVEDWGNRTGDDVPEFLSCYELDFEIRMKGGALDINIPAWDRTGELRDMLSDREREREENNRETHEITASGRTRKL